MLRNPVSVVFAVLALLVGAPAFAGTIKVDSTTDSPDANPGDGKCLSKVGGCTLRAAAEEASASEVGNTIELPAGTYPMHKPDEGEYSEGGVLFLKGEITISGEDSELTLIDGLGKARVFEAENGSIIKISEITVQNAFGQGETGAAILNRGVLTLESVVVRGSRATTDPLIPAGNGAGLLNFGAATVRDSTFEKNIADGRGGAIFNAEGSSLDVLGTSFTGNQSLTDGGGAIASSNTARLTLVSFTGNKAQNGGAIDVISGPFALLDASFVENSSGVGGGAIRSNGQLTAANVTISGNAAAISGGGLWTTGSGQTTLNNVTISGNRAATGQGGKGSGGGIANDPAATTTIGNSIVAGNSSASGKGPDCAGRLNSLGYNLLQNQAGCSLDGVKAGNVVGQAAKLAALDTTSSPTAVLPPEVGSPAIDVGNPKTPTGKDGTCMPVDQRGVPRPQAGAGPEPRCDMGAFELKPAS